MQGSRTTPPPIVRGWTLDDLRVRAESSRAAECSRTSCLEPEANELAEFVLALIDIVEARGE